MQEHKIELDHHHNNIDSLVIDGEKFLNDDYSPDRTKAMVTRLKNMWEGVLRVYNDNNEIATQLQRDWITLENDIQQLQQNTKELEGLVSKLLEDTQDLTIIKVKDNAIEAKVSLI